MIQKTTKYENFFHKKYLAVYIQHCLNFHVHGPVTKPLAKPQDNKYESFMLS